MRASTVLSLMTWLLVLLVPGVALGLLPAKLLFVAAAYVGAIVLSAMIATLRFRSVVVGFLALLAFPLRTLCTPSRFFEESWTDDDPLRCLR